MKLVIILALMVGTISANSNGDLESVLSRQTRQAGVKYVAIKADNGRYLCRTDKGLRGGNVLEANLAVIFYNCKFEIIVNQDNLSISFKADNGRYLGRFNDGQRDSIKADKTWIDGYSKFDIIHHGGTTVSFKADNGNYWYRVPWVAGTNLIQASPIKGYVTDSLTRFTLQQVWL